MNGTNGKQSDFPDVALVPYPVIVAATKGDPDAMKIVLQHFSGYIASLSMRKLCDAGFLHGRCRLRCAAPVYRNFERYIASEIPRD